MEHTVPLVYNLKNKNKTKKPDSKKNNNGKKVVHFIEPRSFEVAKAAFISQGANLYECQDSDWCFLIS